MKRGKISGRNLVSRAEHYIPSAGKLRQRRPYRFTEQAFDMITFYCKLRDTFADHEANTQFCYFIWYPCKDKQPRRYTTSLLPDPLKLTTFAQA